MEDVKRHKFTPKHLFIILTLTLIISGLSFAGGLALSMRHNQKVSDSTQVTCDEVCVSLYSDRASPDTVTVNSGEFIRFNSADGEKHNLTLGSDDKHHSTSAIDEYSSGDFNGDEAWRVQFKEDGTYSFKDKYNDSIRVNVIVYTKDKDYKIN